jgi:hypothetical protein
MTLSRPTHQRVTLTVSRKYHHKQKEEQNMGASGWNYFVPYQPDIFKALQELREAVFQRGEYYQRDPYWKDMTFEEFLPPDLGLSEEDRADYLVEFQELQALPEPTSIETLIQWNGEEGTHSIIDIYEIAPTSSFGVAAPLSSEELKSFFGTDKPTREIIESKETALVEFLQREMGRYRGEGTYIIVYKADEADEICFAGYSGD